MLGPPKGCLPVAASYRTQPKEKMSELAPTSSPRVCSGDMYATVPTTCPRPVNCVSLSSRCNLAIPKSTTFTCMLSSHQNIRRLYVPMDNTCSVCRSQCECDLRTNFRHLLKTQTSSWNHVLQRLRRDVLHNQEVHVASLEMSCRTAMLGWVSADAARASFRKRRLKTRSDASSFESTLIATVRPSRVS